MQLTLENGGFPARRLVLLAPGIPPRASFRQVLCDDTQYHQVLAGVQKLRGLVYLRDGAISQHQLGAGGRHIQECDYDAWHLAVLDGCGEPIACARYLPHQNRAAFENLNVARSALARSPHWGTALRRAIEAELFIATQRGCTFVELGGWAVSDSLWGTTEAARLLVSLYALSRCLGGALGIGTATTRHNASSILRRIGGRSLVAPGGREPLPAYHDPMYACEMEILRFDSREPNPRYEDCIESSVRMLRKLPVIYTDQPAFTLSLANAHHALEHAGNNSVYSPLAATAGD